jgi:hypothetical protein
MERKRKRSKLDKAPRMKWTDNPELVQQLKEMYEQGAAPKEIAEKLNLPVNSTQLCKSPHPRSFRAASSHYLEGTLLVLQDGPHYNSAGQGSNWSAVALLYHEIGRILAVFSCIKCPKNRGLHYLATSTSLLRTRHAFCISFLLN